MTKDRKLSGKILFRHAIVLCVVLAACLGPIRNAGAKNLNGATCADSTLSFNTTTAKAGDTVTLTGTSGLSVCIYDLSITNGDNRVAIGANGTATYTTTQATTLGGVIRRDHGCGSLYSATAEDCRTDSVTVTATSGDDGNDGNNDNGGGTADKPADSISRCNTNGWFFCNPLAGTVDSLTDAGKKSIQAILGLIGTIALFFLIYAGVTYITAAGQEEKVKNAKKMITGTIIGLGIALLAFSLLQTVLKILQ